MAAEVKADEIWRSVYMQSLLKEQDNIDKGRSLEKIEMAKNGLKNNIPLETIAIITGLTIIQIESLENEL